MKGKVKDGKSRKTSRGRRPDKGKTAFTDSIVQEKNVTFPRTSKLPVKIVTNCHKASKSEWVNVRRQYTREVKCLKLTLRFRRKNNNNARKVREADMSTHSLVGKPVRKLLRKLSADSAYMERLRLCMKLFKDEKVNGHKIYSLHNFWDYLDNKVNGISIFQVSRRCAWDFIGTV